MLQEPTLIPFVCTLARMAFFQRRLVIGSGNEEGVMHMSGAEHMHVPLSGVYHTVPGDGRAARVRARHDTVNGRVLNEGDAVLPGATVTATNVATAWCGPPSPTRKACTPDPARGGTYQIKTDLGGFAPAPGNVRLDVDSTHDRRFPAGARRPPGDVDGHRRVAPHRDDPVEGRRTPSRRPRCRTCRRSPARSAACWSCCPGPRRCPAAPHEENVGTVFTEDRRRNVAMTWTAPTTATPLQRPAADVDDRKPGAFQLASSQFTARTRHGGAAVTLLTKSSSTRSRLGLQL